MSSEFLRFEILLPLQFNDGGPVPEEMIVEVETDLEMRFGAISTETQRIRGGWQEEGHTYRDELLRLFADVLKTPDNIQFFRDYKETLKTRFQQKDI